MLLNAQNAVEVASTRRHLSDGATTSGSTSEIDERENMFSTIKESETLLPQMEKLLIDEPIMPYWWQFAFNSFKSDKLDKVDNKHFSEDPFFTWAREVKANEGERAEEAMYAILAKPPSRRMC